jgi:6-phosphogluconolactonase
MRPNVSVFQNRGAAARACAARIAASLNEVLAGQSAASFAISGGAGPAIMFGDLVKERLPWERIHLFWVDERSVPPEDDASNFRIALETLIAPAKISEANIHRIPGEIEPFAAASEYTANIRRHFGLGRYGLPSFDVLHLGMGPDAHTASLFPGSPLLDDRDRIASAAYAPQFRQWRVTLLPGVLLNARRTVALTTGADKAEAFHSVMNKDNDLKRYPAQLARDAEWFVDEDAARQER